MSDPVPSAKQLEDFAFKCVVAIVVCMACAIVDGYDGVVSMKSHTYRLVDDPAGFKGLLSRQWGDPALLALGGALATGIGALVVKAPGKASKDQ